MILLGCFIGWYPLCLAFIVPIVVAIKKWRPKYVEQNKNSDRSGAD